MAHNAALINSIFMEVFLGAENHKKKIYRASKMLLMEHGRNQFSSFKIVHISLIINSVC